MAASAPVSAAASDPQIKRVEDCFNYLAEIELFRRIYMVFVNFSLTCLHAILSIEDFSKLVDSMEPVSGEPDKYRTDLEWVIQRYVTELSDPLIFPTPPFSNLSFQGLNLHAI